MSGLCKDYKKRKKISGNLCRLPSAVNVIGSITSETTSHEQDDDDGESDQASLLFSCPEERCINAYSRFTSLQAHLETGKHKRQSEQETLYDKTNKANYNVNNRASA